MRSLFKWALITLGVVVIGSIALGGYRLYRVFYGIHVYESLPPELPANLNPTAILIFSKTNGFREDSAVKAANAALQKIADKNGWSAVVTENGAVFNSAMLSKFKATVWNNTSGDLLTPKQRMAFQTFIENGGGFVGIHGAGGDPHYDWQWYVNTIIGTQFKGHPLNPQFQEATIHVEDPDDPAMKGVGQTWVRTDEWYSFEKSPRGNGVKVLATLDEGTYQPKMLWKNIRMGADHPVIWEHCVGRGRVFYSALGHQASAYREQRYLGVLEGAIKWACGLEGQACLR